MQKLVKKERGFTLFETLLVLGIMSAFLVMSLRYVSQRATEARIDKTSVQYQQILNAALAYYLNKSQWPAMNDLITDGYLSPSFSNAKNPWGGTYTLVVTNNLFYVYSAIPASLDNIAQAQRIAGKLPQAFASLAAPPVTPPISACVLGTPCYVAAAVTVPGQNLNNARAVNFANLYHPGACVPAPVCPAGTTEQIMVIPVSVTGANDPSSIYPISSFTAYAVPDPPDFSTNIPSCVSGAIQSCNNPSDMSATTKYWRVCLEIVSEFGNVGVTNPDYGQDVTVLAITRCSPDSEPFGSDFTVYETP